MGVPASSARRSTRHRRRRRPCRTRRARCPRAEGGSAGRGRYRPPQSALRLDAAQSDPTGAALPDAARLSLGIDGPWSSPAVQTSEQIEGGATERGPAYALTSVEAGDRARNSAQERKRPGRDSRPFRMSHSCRSDRLFFFGRPPTLSLLGPDFTFLSGTAHAAIFSV